MTVSHNTDDVIEALVADAMPVRRLWPPALRAALWLGAVAAIAALAVLFFADRGIFMRRAEDPKLILELIGTALTGIAAILAAFELSLPDRSPYWALAPLPPLTLWIASSGYSCWRHWILAGPGADGGWQLGESADCFRFILALSLPLALSLVPLLRRAAPLTPIRVAALGGLGIAACAAFLLQFFHPFDVTFMDLGLHLAATGFVVAIIAGSEMIARAWRFQRKDPG